MATYYTTSSSNNQRETPMIYPRETLPTSYPETQFLPSNAMIYMNPAVSSYSDSLPGEAMEATVSASQEHHQVLSSTLGGSSQMQDVQDFDVWRDQSGSRNGILLMHPMAGATTSILQTGQGLSLSLGSQIIPGIHQMNHQNNPFRSDSNLGVLRNEHSRANEYASHGFSGGNHQTSGVARSIHNSKYLKAAQQLLDEVVNVRKALKQFQPEGDKNQENPGEQPAKEGGGGGDTDSNPQESSTNPSREISHSERQELQSKLTKLLSMLDEVDRRYKQYYHQMQIVVSSFDVIVGSGAAKPYTALALQTISRHFRCLRDAISGQITVTRKALGEQDGSDNKGVGITRLRYVDQQLRQQRALQQLGMMQQHAWRPQRGLPESSVSILRAWLFEHFLHPYPRDSDKIMLARQTGLSRSQVSNWFINARVRLWKPMVEEMYKEEFADAAEMDSNSSSENTPTTTKADQTRTSDDRAEEALRQVRSTQNQQTESRSDHILETGYGQGSSSLDNCNMFQDTMIHDDQMVDGGRYMAADPRYHAAEMGRFGGGVSLTLGLQNFEAGGALPMAGGTHHSFIGMRGEAIYENATDGSNFEYVTTGNGQHRLSSSQLLHGFVAR